MHFNSTLFFTLIFTAVVENQQEPLKITVEKKDLPKESRKLTCVYSALQSFNLPDEFKNKTLLKPIEPNEKTTPEVFSITSSAKYNMIYYDMAKTILKFILSDELLVQHFYMFSFDNLCYSSPTFNNTLALRNNLYEVSGYQMAMVSLSDMKMACPNNIKLNITPSHKIKDLFKIPLFSLVIKANYHVEHPFLNFDREYIYGMETYELVGAIVRRGKIYNGSRFKKYSLPSKYLLFLVFNF